MFSRLRFSFTLFMITIPCLNLMGCKVLGNRNVSALVSKDTTQSTDLPDAEKSIVEYSLPERFITETAPPAEFRVGKDDKLEIFVYAQKDLTTTQRVRPDGKVAFPLVGDIEARGRTPNEIREALEKRLSKYLREPQVTVLITEYNSKTVSILGEVSKPGLLTLISDVNLLEGIARAGGVTESADLQGALLVRNGQVVQVNFNKLLRYGDARQNVILQDKDTILIPNISVKKVFVLGEVMKPLVVILKGDVTILDAILQAGGFSRRAKTQNIFVIRGGLGSSTLLQVNLKTMLDRGDTASNVLLQPHDIIYVPPTIIADVLQFFQDLNTVLSPIILAETGIAIGPAVKSVLTTGTTDQSQPIVVNP